MRWGVQQLTTNAVSFFAENSELWWWRGWWQRFQFAGSLSPKTAAGQNNRTYCESDTDDDTYHGGALRAVLWLYHVTSQILNSG